jgi:hypothetical protein
MGMYDSVFFRGAAAEMVKCAAGHPQTGEFQTKDLECTCAIYYVHATDGGQGLVLFEGTAQTTESFVDKYARLQETVRSTYAPRLVNASVEVYTSCETCDPVVFEREAAHWGGRVVRARVQKNGIVTVLPDDDRVAKRHLEVARKAPRSPR